MGIPAKRSTIVSFLRARNPRGLRRLIMREEAKDGIVYDWDIKQGSDGFWYAWYRKNMANIKTEEDLEQGGN